MDKSESVKIRLDNDLLEQLREQARENERTLAKEISYQLKNKEKEQPKMEQLETFAEYCRNYIIDALDEYQGATFGDAWELAHKITESDNVSGSMTFSTYKAEQYIKNWFENVGVFLEQYEREYGEQPPHSPFNDAELFHALMVIYGIEILFSQINALNTDKPQELTEQLSEHIKQEIKKLFPLFDYVENHQGK